MVLHGVYTLYKKSFQIFKVYYVFTILINWTKIFLIFFRICFPEPMERPAESSPGLYLNLVDDWCYSRYTRKFHIRGFLFESLVDFHVLSFQLYSYDSYIIKMRINSKNAYKNVLYILYMKTALFLSYILSLYCRYEIFAYDAYAFLYFV